MPAYKHTMLIEHQSNLTGGGTITRLGGFSESYYKETLDMNGFSALCRRRAAMLPAGSRIVGQRFQQVDPTGSSTTGGEVIQGNLSQVADIPQVALLCKATSSSAPNTRSLILRAIPDASVVEGELKPTSPYAQAFVRFAVTLTSGGWQWRGRQLNATQAKILSIDALGVPTVEGVFPFANGTMVRVSKAKKSDGRFVSGLFKVNISAAPTVISLLNWPGDVTTGGKMIQNTIIYPLFGEIDPNRVITKKVGRPFVGYRGRRSKRK